MGTQNSLWKKPAAKHDALMQLNVEPGAGHGHIECKSWTSVLAFIRNVLAMRVAATYDGAQVPADLKQVRPGDGWFSLSSGQLLWHAFRVLGSALSGFGMSALAFSLPWEANDVLRELRAVHLHYWYLGAMASETRSSIRLSKRTGLICWQYQPQLRSWFHAWGRVMTSRPAMDRLWRNATHSFVFEMSA
jgi:hypothetical protein